jgi:drug/metabolite transporter (DMT)-like permease
VISFLFFFSILVLSQAATLIRFTEAPSLAICFWRLLISGILFLPLALRKKNFAAFRSLTPVDWAQVFLSGAFLFAHFYLFFRSVQETTIANSTVLFALNPVTTALGAYWLFAERVTLHLALACAFGMGGVGMLFSESLTGRAGDFHGDIWALVSAVCFSGYVLTGKSVRRKLSNSAFACCVYLQTAIYASVAMVLAGVRFTGYSTQTWWMFLALAIFPTLLGHAIFTYCLNYLNVNFMSCMTLVEPVFAAGVAIWLFNEPLTVLATFGFLLTCLSVVALYWDTLLALGRRVRTSSKGINS